MRHLVGTARCAVSVAQRSVWATLGACQEGCFANVRCALDFARALTAQRAVPTFTPGIQLARAEKAAMFAVEA